MNADNSLPSTSRQPKRRGLPRQTWRTVLASDRLFKTGIIVLVVLMLGVMAGLNLYMFSKAHSFFFDALEVSNLEGSMTMILALSDNLYEIFRPHWAELIQPLPQLKTEAALRERLNQVASLPGVDRAFLLSAPDNLMVSQGEVYPALKDSLAERRNIFKGYQLGGLKHPRKFHHWLFNQIRFENLTQSPDDTLRMIFAAFDSSGKSFQVVPEKRFQPEMVNAMIALQIDEDWIKQAVLASMDTLFYDRQIFALWSKADPKSGAETLGAGILGFGDTLWWAGLKNVEAKSDAEGMVSDWPWHNSKWFSFRTVIDAADLQYIGRKPHRIFVMVLALADLGLLIIGYLLVTWLFVLRRQWLNQQFALAHLAHAVKTPVARIRIETDSLLKSLVASPEEEKEVISTIDRECANLEGAVKSAALTMEGIGDRIELSQTDLRAVVQNAEARWRERYIRSSVKLALNLPSREVTCLAATDLLGVALDNLLDNALRHTSLQAAKDSRKALEVDISMAAENHLAKITIDDQGGGIDPAIRKSLFKRYRKSHADAATGASGLGLGLALTAEIIKAHKGRIEVSVNQRGGSTFALWLPIFEEREA